MVNPLGVIAGLVCQLILLPAIAIGIAAISGLRPEHQVGLVLVAACPGGAIANLLHSRAERSADWVEEALAATARDLGATGRDTDFGYGILDAAAAELVK